MGARSGPRRRCTLLVVERRACDAAAVQRRYVNLACDEGRPILLAHVMDLAAYYKQQFRWRDWTRAMGALPDLSGQVVLDLGCGIGDQAELLVARGAKVRGFDLNGE